MVAGEVCLLHSAAYLGQLPLRLGLGAVRSREPLLAVLELCAQARQRCRGALAASSVLGRRLVAQRRGGLILCSSGAGFQGTGFVAGYSAAKAWSLALAEALWWEWRPHGVDVLALCPGSTATPGMLGNAPRLDAAAMARPADVAREALDALGHGPVCIPGEDNRRARAALDELPRQQVVELVSEQTRKLFTG